MTTGEALRRQLARDNGIALDRMTSVPTGIDLDRFVPAFGTIVATIPVQCLAYYIAVHRGCDVDQPRNLAKTVTVE